MSRGTLDSCPLDALSGTRVSLSLPQFPICFPLRVFLFCRSATPIARGLLVWALPVSLAATQGVSVDFFSSGYLDVSVRRVSLLTMLFLQIAGCPIRRYMVLCLLAAPHVFSQLTASFVVAERQGIHRMPLLA